MNNQQHNAVAHIETPLNISNDPWGAVFAKAITLAAPGEVTHYGNAYEMALKNGGKATLFFLQGFPNGLPDNLMEDDVIEAEVVETLNAEMRTVVGLVTTCAEAGVEESLRDAYHAAGGAMFRYARSSHKGYGGAIADICLTIVNETSFDAVCPAPLNADASDADDVFTYCTEAEIEELTSALANASQSIIKGEHCFEFNLKTGGRVLLIKRLPGGGPLAIVTDDVKHKPRERLESAILNAGVGLQEVSAEKYGAAVAGILTIADNEAESDAS